MTSTKITYLTFDLPTKKGYVFGGVGTSIYSTIRVMKKHIVTIICPKFKTTPKKFQGINVFSLDVFDSYKYDSLNKFVNIYGYKKFIDEFNRVIKRCNISTNIVYLEGIELGNLSCFFKNRQYVVYSHLQWLSSEYIYNLLTNKSMYVSKKIRIFRFFFGFYFIFILFFRLLYLISYNFYFANRNYYICGEINALRYSDKIFVCSNGQKKFLQLIYMSKIRKKIYDVPSILPNVKYIQYNKKNINNFVSSFKKKYSISQNDFVILSFSRINPQKAIERLFFSVKLLEKKINPKLIKVFIVGDCINSDKVYFEYLNLLSLTLKSQTFFIQGLYNEEKIGIFDLSSVFVLLSNFEPFGLTFIDALNSGIPILCSRTHASLDIFGEKSDCLIDFSKKNSNKFLSRKLYAIYRGNAPSTKNILPSVQELSNQYKQILA